MGLPRMSASRTSGSALKQPGPFIAGAAALGNWQQDCGCEDKIACSQVCL